MSKPSRRRLPLPEQIRKVLVIRPRFVGDICLTLPVLDNLRRFFLVNLATSLGWDLGRGVTTVVMTGLFGGIVLRTLRRAAHRAAFIIVARGTTP